jgi:enoyl-CoA hydratase/carnithine racemase
MAYETILYEVADEVATITLNRPDKLNAYTPAMGTEIIDAMRRADADGGVRVIIMTGAGRAFCAGGDIARFASNIKARETGEDPDAAFGGREPMFSFPTVMRALSKPTIVAINGYALGVGCTMTLPFDVRIASESAKLGLIFPHVGLMTEIGSTYLLPRLIGTAHAAEMMLTGRHFSAQECLARGLVSQVTPHAALMARARELAGEMLQCSPASLAYTRRALYQGLEGTLEKAVEFEESALKRLHTSAEHKEYVSAFLEKRKPDLRRVKS